MQELTNGQIAVLNAFYEFGPMTDITLTAYVHHTSPKNMASSGIRTRRSELVRKGLVEKVDEKKLKSGRMAAVHTLTQEGRNLWK